MGKNRKLIGTETPFMVPAARAAMGVVNVG